MANTNIDKLVEIIAPEQALIFDKVELEKRFKTGEATFYDALIYKLHVDGLSVPEGVVKLSKKNKKFMDIVVTFPERTGDAFSINNFIKYYNSLAKKKHNLLDANYYQGTTIDGLDPLATKQTLAGGRRLSNDLSTTLVALDKLVYKLGEEGTRFGRQERLSGEKGSLLSQVRGKRKFPRWGIEPELTYKLIAKGISKVPDPEMRKVLFLTNMHIGRTINHAEITMSQEISESRINKQGSASAARPYIIDEDITYGTGKNQVTRRGLVLYMPFEEGAPEAVAYKRGAGKKYTYDRVVLGELLTRSLMPLYDEAKKKNRKHLFSKNITQKTMSDAVNKYVYPLFDKGKIGRELHGIADLRRIGISSMIYGQGLPEQAVLLSGHPMEILEENRIGNRVVARAYATPFGLDPVGINKAMVAREHYIASLLGFDDLINMGGPDAFDVLPIKDVEGLKIEVIKAGDPDAGSKFNRTYDDPVKAKVLSSKDKTKLHDTDLKNTTSRNESIEIEQLDTEIEKTEKTLTKEQLKNNLKEEKIRSDNLDGKLDEIEKKGQALILAEVDELDAEYIANQDKFYGNNPEYTKDRWGNWVRKKVLTDADKKEIARRKRLGIYGVTGVIGVSMLVDPQGTLASESAYAITSGTVRAGTGGAAHLAAKYGGTQLAKFLAAGAVTGPLAPATVLGITAAEAFLPTQLADAEPSYEEISMGRERERLDILHGGTGILPGSEDLTSSQIKARDLVALQKVESDIELDNYLRERQEEKGETFVREQDIAKDLDLGVDVGRTVMHSLKNLTGVPDPDAEAADYKGLIYGEGAIKRGGSMQAGDPFADVPEVDILGEQMKDLGW